MFNIPEEFDPSGVVLVFSEYHSLLICDPFHGSRGIQDPPDAGGITYLYKISKGTNYYDPGGVACESSTFMVQNNRERLIGGSF